MSQKAISWGRIPWELKGLQQWAICDHTKIPMTSDGRGGFKAISVHSKDELLSFNDAAMAAHRAGEKYSIGFILNKFDAYSCIDLDVKDATNEKNPAKWTSEDQFQRFWDIVQAFDSYTERSLSKKGLHIWVKGKVGSGLRRDGVEIYSQERFIICTGDCILPHAIAEKQPLLEQLAGEISKSRDLIRPELIEIESPISDEEVMEIASTAENSDKFNALCLGMYQDLGFESQSEADFALLSMFTFYSKSNEQVRSAGNESPVAQNRRNRGIKEQSRLDAAKRFRGFVFSTA